MSEVFKEYQKNAQKIGLTVKRSSNKSKKLDCFDKNGKKIRSKGAKGMNDFVIYKHSDEMDFALKRQKLFYKRHEKNIQNKFAKDGRLSAAYLSAKILWT